MRWDGVQRACSQMAIDSDSTDPCWNIASVKAAIGCNASCSVEGSVDKATGWLAIRLKVGWMGKDGMVRR